MTSVSQIPLKDGKYVELQILCQEIGIEKLLS